MNETPKTIAQPAMPVRKPWHEPLFYEAGVAATYAVHNAASDGQTSAPTLS
jgi:hypothetical protein